MKVSLLCPSASLLADTFLSEVLLSQKLIMKVMAAMCYNTVVGAGFEEIHHCEMLTFVHFSKCVASTLSVLYRSSLSHFQKRLMFLIMCSSE